MPTLYRLSDRLSISIPDELRGAARTIVVDLPWPNEKLVRSKKGWPADLQTPYETWTLAECAAFPFEVFAHPDGAHVWFWTKEKLQLVAGDIIRAHGVRYSFVQDWRKMTRHGKTDGPKPYNMPKYIKEPCIYGRLGSPGEFLDTKRFATILDGLRREHSRKPFEFYAQLERVCPGPWVDVFSREDRPGWLHFGNETGKFNREAA